MIQQLLCYFPDPEAPLAAAVRRASLPLKLRLRLAAPDQTGQSVGFLLGRKGFEPLTGQAPAVTDPILILDGLAGPRLDTLLRALARAGVPRSVFKAVVTPGNVNWTLAQLWRELKKEREALAQGAPPAHHS